MQAFFVVSDVSMVVHLFNRKCKPTPVLLQFLQRRIKPRILRKVEFLTAELPDTNLRKMIGQPWMNQHPVIVGNRNQSAVEGTVKCWREDDANDFLVFRIRKGVQSIDSILYSFYLKPILVPMIS